MPLEKQIEKWGQVLNSHCKQAFKKIRIKDRNLGLTVSLSVSLCVSIFQNSF